MAEILPFPNLTPRLRGARALCLNAGISGTVSHVTEDSRVVVHCDDGITRVPTFDCVIVDPNSVSGPRPAAVTPAPEPEPAA